MFRDGDEWLHFATDPDSLPILGAVHSVSTHRRTTGLRQVSQSVLHVGQELIRRGLAHAVECLFLVWVLQQVLGQFSASLDNSLWPVSSSPLRHSPV